MERDDDLIDLGEVVIETKGPVAITGDQVGQQTLFGGGISDE
ncbi:MULTISPECIES: benenodin family lasso peptide [Sphingobium]|jgi:hypothetical protein|nr:benenodin family lasso peptide [Sphingobium sp. RSMS]UXC92978.1 benenodin family lasso peptide [Sphingobium sp. RSMS]